jgi:formylmethanofuran dehydrogenase subunit E
MRHKICGIDLDDYIIRMEEFHGYKSPGMLIGGFMVEAALDRSGSSPYLNIVTESAVCLPDAVQLLTPCTIGNGFLQIKDWGIFALTAYDRKNLTGLRVSLDLDCIGNYPLIHQWFDRSARIGEKPPFDAFMMEAIAACREVIMCQSVRMKRALKEVQRVPTGRCAGCGESFALRLGDQCPACSGSAYCFPEVDNA